MWNFDEERRGQVAECRSRVEHAVPPPDPEPPATRNTPNAHPDLSVPDWVRQRLAFHPDPSQERVLSPSIRRGLLNCCRQWGKSTVTAAKAVHHACHQPASLTLAVSPNARQSAEFLRKAAAFARQLGIRPKGDGDNQISLEFPNAARIVVLPGTEATIRGFSAVGLLLVDDASRVPRRPLPGKRKMTCQMERNPGSGSKSGPRTWRL